MAMNLTKKRLLEIAGQAIAVYEDELNAECKTRIEIHEILLREFQLTEAEYQAIKHGTFNDQIIVEVEDGVNSVWSTDDSFAAVVLDHDKLASPDCDPEYAANTTLWVTTLLNSEYQNILR